MVSWSQCRLVETLADDGDPATDDTQIVPCTEARLANVIVSDPDNPVTPAVGEFTVAPPLYGIWIYDPRDDTQLPVVAGEEGFMFTEVVSADPRPVPPVVADGGQDFLLDASLADKGEALLNIRNVYDFDGSCRRRYRGVRGSDANTRGRSRGALCADRESGFHSRRRCS